MLRWQYVSDGCLPRARWIWSLNMRTAQVNFIFCHLILISSHFNRPSNFYFIHLQLSPKRGQATETWQMRFILENFALRSSSQCSTCITSSPQSCCVLALIYVRLISQSPQFKLLEHAKETMKCHLSDKSNMLMKHCKAPDLSEMHFRWK